MKIKTSLILCLTFAGFCALVSSQLILPTQICEWQQMKLRNITGSVSYNNPVMVEIRDYCLKHAYDHIGNLGTLG